MRRHRVGRFRKRLQPGRTTAQSTECMSNVAIYATKNMKAHPIEGSAPHARHCSVVGGNDARSSPGRRRERRASARPARVPPGYHQGAGPQHRVARRCPKAAAPLGAIPVQGSDRRCKLALGSQLSLCRGPFRQERMFGELIQNYRYGIDKCSARLDYGRSELTSRLSMLAP